MMNHVPLTKVLRSIHVVTMNEMRSTIVLVRHRRVMLRDDGRNDAIVRIGKDATRLAMGGCDRGEGRDGHGHGDRARFARIGHVR